MKKYLYTMRVKKVVVYDEITIQVKAANEVEAKRLAKTEAECKNWVDVDNVKYKVELYSYTCKPVEE